MSMRDPFGRFHSDVQPPSAPPFALGSADNIELPVCRCSSCGDVAAVSYDRGVPFCDPCIGHGTLDATWADWDDLGGGD